MNHVLGSGAYATVWHAHDPFVDHTVAIKVLADNWSRNPRIVSKFKTEARVMMAAPSQRIVQAFHCAESEGQPYLVMAYADRGTLADRIKARQSEKRRFTLDEVLEIGREIALAISDVHAMNHLHRDVKPSNVLFAARGETEQLMLGDFGFVRSIESLDATAASGTPAYMAPEQAAGEDGLTPASELYPLGMIMLEMLAGDKPDRPQSLEGAAKQGHVDVSYHLEARTVDAPADLVDLIEALLDPDPTRRPASALQVANMLSSIGHASHTATAAVPGSDSASPAHEDSAGTSHGASQGTSRGASGSSRTPRVGAVAKRRKRRPGDGVPEIDGYTDIAPLPDGVGGYSQVYIGTEGSGRRVALKVLNYDATDPAKRASFENEVRAMAGISSHPNIVTLFGVAYTDAGQPVIAMEYCGRGSLKTAGQLSAAQTMDFGVKLSSALAAAHEAGIAHRDIKPGNVFVTDYGQPALGDFGIASFSDQQSPESAFTTPYAPPEVIRAAAVKEPVDLYRADVYSLGATLYTAAAGRRAFARVRGEDRAALARRVIADEPPNLENFGVPEPLADRVRRSMAKSPSARPGTVREFGESLRSLQERLGYSKTEWFELVATPTVPRSVQPYTSDGEDQTKLHSVAPARRAEPTVAAVPATTASRTRGLIGAGLGMLALAVIGSVLYFGGRDNAAESIVTAPVDVAVPQNTEFYSAPRPPTEVSMVRLNGGRVEISWESTNTDAVTFEFERIDAASQFLGGTTDDSMIIEQIGTREQPCVRGWAVGLDGRSTSISDPVCLAADEAPKPDIDVSPSVCEPGACTVVVTVSGDSIAAGDRMRVRIESPDVTNGGLPPVEESVVARAGADGTVVAEVPSEADWPAGVWVASAVKQGAPEDDAAVAFFTVGSPGDG